MKRPQHLASPRKLPQVASINASGSTRLYEEESGVGHDIHGIFVEF